MNFVKITDLKNCDDVKQLYYASFPVEEQVEFDKLFPGCLKIMFYMASISRKS